MKKNQIPNIITLCSVFCGWLATVFAFRDYYLASVGLILLGGVFDYFDGYIARKLKVSSRIGENIDSLADLITFGVAPSVMLFSVLQLTLGECPKYCPRKLYVYAPVFVVIASVYRLANFDIDKNDKKFFVGVPTPLNGIVLAVWCCLVFIYYQTSILKNYFFETTIVLTLVQSYLLNFNIYILSLKVKNNILYILVLISIVIFLTFVFELLGFLIGIAVFYIVSHYIIKNKK